MLPLYQRQRVSTSPETTFAPYATIGSQNKVIKTPDAIDFGQVGFDRGRPYLMAQSVGEEMHVFPTPRSCATRESSSIVCPRSLAKIAKHARTGSRNSEEASTQPHAKRLGVESGRSTGGQGGQIRRSQEAPLRSHQGSNWIYFDSSTIKDASDVGPYGQ